MMSTNKFNKALAVASLAHAGQKRKTTNIDYITHPIEVANLVACVTNDQNTLCTALLHDVL